MSSELTIKGTIESLHLAPGDVVIATVDGKRVTQREVADLYETLCATFPGHKCLIVEERIKLSTVTEA